jgi:fructokinase
MYDVVALGELLIDFTPAGVSAAGNVLFERNPGGAPANVLAAVSKLGGKGAFIGKVGDDQFGSFLRATLEERGIETHGLKVSQKANTTLAFVHLDANGDRSFSFYRKPGADTMLETEDLELELIDRTAIYHFGSLSMTDEPARSATYKAVEYARLKGRIISYDPNWRPLLWKDDATAHESMLSGFKYADIVKLSGEEMEFLLGTADMEKGSRALLDMGVKLAIVTLGPRGCYFRCAAGSGYMKTYNTKVVDTTGAGDAFLGGVLYRISRCGEPIGELKLETIRDILDFANAVGSMCAAKKGAIPAMPSLEEVEACRRETPKLDLE